MNFKFITQWNKFLNYKCMWHCNMKSEMDHCYLFIHFLEMNIRSQLFSAFEKSWLSSFCGLEANLKMSNNSVHFAASCYLCNSKCQSMRLRNAGTLTISICVSSKSQARCCCRGMALQERIASLAFCLNLAWCLNNY